MFRKSVAFTLTVTVAAAILVACSHGGRRCAGADPLTAFILVDKGGGTGGSSSGGGARSSPAPVGRVGGAPPANSGARTQSPAAGGSKAPSTPTGPSGRVGEPPPANSGARPAANSQGAPRFAGARSGGTFTDPPRSGGRVPAFSGNSIGRTFTAPNNRVYVVHPRSYYGSRPPDPWDPYDYRNSGNPFSPFYGETVYHPC